MTIGEFHTQLTIMDTTGERRKLQNNTFDLHKRRAHIKYIYETLSLESTHPSTQDISPGKQQVKFLTESQKTLRTQEESSTRDLPNHSVMNLTQI